MLAQWLMSLSVNDLLDIQNVLIEAGISNEFKGDYKKLFRELRDRSSGRKKKICAALAKASREEMMRMSDQLCRKY